MILRYENKEYVLKKPLVQIDESTGTPDEIAFYNKHNDDAKKFTCKMVVTMEPELQNSYEDYWTYEMCIDLAEKFTRNRDKIVMKWSSLLWRAS